MSRNFNSGEDDPLHQLHLPHDQQPEDDPAKKVYVDWPENDDFEYRFVSSRVGEYAQDDAAVPRSPEPYDSLNDDPVPLTLPRGRAPRNASPGPAVEPLYAAPRHSSRTDKHHHTPLSYHSTSSNASHKRISPKKNTVTPMPEPRRKDVTDDEEEAQLLEEELRYQNVLRQRVQENEERDNEYEIPPLHLDEIEHSGDFVVRDPDDVMEISVRSNHAPFPESIPQYRMPAGVAKLSDFVDSLDTEIDRWEEKGDHAETNEPSRTNDDNQSLPYQRREEFQVISPRQDQTEPQRSERARSIQQDAQRIVSRQTVQPDSSQPEHRSRQRLAASRVPTQQRTRSQSPGPAQRAAYGSPQQAQRADSKESYRSMRSKIPVSPQRQSPHRPSRGVQDSDMSSRDSSVARPRATEQERPRHHERPDYPGEEARYDRPRDRNYDRAPPKPSPKRNPPVPYEHYPTEQDYPDNHYPDEAYPGSYDYPYGDVQPSPRRNRPPPRQNRPPVDERYYRPNDGYRGDPVEERGFYGGEAPTAPDNREVRHQASSPLLPSVHDDRRRRFSDASAHDSQIRPEHKLRQSHRSMEEIYSARREALDSHRRKLTDRPNPNTTDFVQKNKHTYGFTKRESGYASYYSRKQEQHATSSAPSRILSRKPPLPGIKPRSQRNEFDDSASDRSAAAPNPEQLWAQRSKALSKRADKRSPQKRNEAVQADIARTPSGPSNSRVPSYPSAPKIPSGPAVADERSESKFSGRTVAAEPQKVSIDLNVNITPQGFQIPQHQEAFVKQAPGPPVPGPQVAPDDHPSQYIRPYADPYVLDKAFRSPRDLQLQERTPSDLDKLVYSQTATNPFTPLPPIANERNEEDEEPVKDGYLAMFRKDQNIKQGVEKRMYKPYSFSDFKRMPKEVKLGGLGPDVDSETHKEKVEKRLRAEQYARQAHERNLQRLRAARPKLSPKAVAPEQIALVAPQQQVVHRQPPPRDVFSPSIVVKTSRRQAAIDYAKRLQRPPSTKTSTKPRSTRQNNKPTKPQQPEPELIDLQRLLERHERDKENVATVRAKLLEV